MRLSMTCLLAALLAAGCSGGSNAGSSSSSGSSGSTSASGSSGGGASGASATVSGGLEFPEPPAQSYVRYGAAIGDGGISVAADGGPDLRTVQWSLSDHIDVSGCGVFGTSAPQYGYIQVSGVVQTAGSAPIAAGSYTVPVAGTGLWASVRYSHALEDGGFIDIFADAGTVTFTTLTTEAAVGTFDGFFALSDGGSSELQGSFSAPYCPR